MILRKSEQKSDTMMELMNEKMMLPSWMAFSSFISFFANATIRKSTPKRKKISKV